MTKKVMHIYRPIGESTIVIEYEKREVEKCPSLAELQELVGGLIELIEVDFEGNKCDMICNEESKLIGMPFNSSATRLYENTYGPYDFITGPAIVFEGFKLP